MKTIIQEYASQLGKRGGKKTLKLYKKEHFSKMGKASAEARKKRQAAVDNST